MAWIESGLFFFFLKAEFIQINFLLQKNKGRDGDALRGLLSNRPQQKGEATGL